MKTPNDQTDEYDVIVVGSGIGGLTAASLLAQVERKRVLLLERHFKIGGFTHTFSRQGKYEWDVGLHYVGDMEVGEPTRAMFDLITNGQVDWHPMPEVFDRMIFPEISFDVPVGLKRQETDLMALFPAETESIRKYFRDLGRGMGWMGRYLMTLALPSWLRIAAKMIRGPGRGLALTSARDYLDRTFRDERLKAIVMGQWGLHGLPPSRVAFAGHALLMIHYANGGYYPVGGSSVIADSVQPLITERGGAVLHSHAVEEIVVEDGRAVGVRVHQIKGKQRIAKTFRANAIVSNAGAHTTYTKLLPADIELPFREAIEKFPNGTANVTLYLGLMDSPEKLGLRGENIWIYSEYDHDAMDARRNELVDGQVSSVFLSFPSAKNPQAKGPTAEIIAFCDAEPFVAWEDKPWLKRGEDYDRLKQDIADALIRFVEKRVPGFAELIEYSELGTPITTEYFTHHRNGNIYGLPMIPERFQYDWLGPRTPIKDLYLAGADAAIFGIVGGMMGGVLAASAVAKRWLGPVGYFGKAMSFSRKLHAEKE